MPANGEGVEEKSNEAARRNVRERWVETIDIDAAFMNCSARTSDPTLQQQKKRRRRAEHEAAEHGKASDLSVEIS